MTAAIIILIVLVCIGALSGSEDLSEHDDQELLDELNRRN